MKSVGDNFEHRAARYLQSQGLRVIARNYRCRAGELDLVAVDASCLVFVEVRSRSNPRYASAAASVDLRKRRRLIRAAQSFLQKNPQWAQRPCRFDVVTFQPRQSTPEPLPQWIRSAFTE